ncbi:glycosyltransferase family 2 protein [Curtobacterium luteum]|uniref:glycosyltransferase family 2 protein n=1 Tax=Curtobacterium luteum TaxID=33881 RepID=UPI0037F69758
MAEAGRDEEPELSVVLVTYNSAHVVTAALDGLGERRGTEVVLVDNDSTDGTADLVRDRYPHVIVVESGGNLGFAKGVNLGVRHARGSFVMLLNPDATIAEPDLRALLAAARRDPGSVFAPFVEQPAPQRIVSAGWAPSTWRMFAHYSGLSRLGRHARWLQGHYLLPAQVRSPVRVDWATGACLLLSRGLWDRLGGLSERWFMYAEDVEFCWRVRSSGHDVWLLPEARATHLVGASDGRRTDSVDPAWVVNLREFHALTMARGRASTASWTVVVAAGLASRAALAAVRHGPRSDAARRFSAYSAALVRSHR